MDDPPGTLDALAAHAREFHVVVIGGGIGGLVAALTCAKIGMSVTVVEASDRLGGAIHTAEVGGVPVDVGAEGYATRGGAVRELVDELGLTPAVEPAAPRDEWIAGLPDGSAPVPPGSIRGIPENPWDERVRRVIGWRGAWRAYVDRVRPPLTIGQERSLGRLVRTRMGPLVLDRLVAPLSLGAFAIHPDDVDVEAVAPGLSTALTRTGNLAGAVAQLRAAAPRSTEPGLETIDGGMSRLAEVIDGRLRELDVRIELGMPVTALERAEDARWTVATDTSTEIERADAVILAAGADETRRLLADAVPPLEFPAGTELEVVTLVLTAAHDQPARKTAVYAAPGRGGAASVTDSTARWAWQRRAAGPGVRVIKVTFGGPEGRPATARLDDDGTTALALAEASALLETPFSAVDVRGSHRARYVQPPPVSALGQREATEAARAAVHAVPGLAIVGAAVAGTGIAQVVPDAIAEAERVRHAALWGA